MRLDHAIDRYLGDLARQGKSGRTRDDYRRKLTLLCGPEAVVEPPAVGAVTADECRAHLDLWRDSAAGTRYHSWAVLSGFFKWLYRTEMIVENPMLRVEAPKRQASEDLDVVSVTGGDVRQLFDVCETWGELLCISTLAYLGPRRGAVSELSVVHVDLSRGR